MPRASSFLCSECGQEFTRHWDCKRHVKDVHRKLRPYVCEFCGKTFGQSGTLLTHQRAVHLPDKPVACRVPGCAERFGDTSARTRHEYGMHAPPGFICPEPDCSGAFKRKERLKDHVLREHIGRWPTYTPAQIKNTMNARRFKDEILRPQLATAGGGSAEDDEMADDDDEPEERLPTTSQLQRLKRRRRSQTAPEDEDDHNEDAPTDQPQELVEPAVNPYELPGPGEPQLVAPAYMRDTREDDDDEDAQTRLILQAPRSPAESQTLLPANMLPEGVPAGLGEPVYNYPPGVFYQPHGVAYAFPYPPFAMMPTAPPVPQAYTNSHRLAYGAGNALGLYNTNPEFQAPSPPPSGFSYYEGALFVDPRALTSKSPQPPPPTPLAGPSSAATAFTNTSAGTPPAAAFYWREEGGD